MLWLHSKGDPTGRGEVFSFIRISMKEIFIKAGEDYKQKMGKGGLNCLEKHTILMYIYS